MSFLSLFFGGALKTGIGLFGKLTGWLGTLNVWQIACIVLGIFAGIQHIAIVGERHHMAKVAAHDHATSLRADLCERGRQADRDAYAKAQDEAKAQNLAQVKTVEQRYQRNTDDERQAYLNDLARLRAGGLRIKAAPAPSGPAGRPGSSAAPAPAAGADADGLSLSSDEHLQAAEIELRLMHLQNWVDKQLTVDPNR